MWIDVSNEAMRKHKKVNANFIVEISKYEQTNLSDFYVIKMITKDTFVIDKKQYDEIMDYFEAKYISEHI